MCEITEYSKDFVFVIICLTVAGIYLGFFLYFSDQGRCATPGWNSSLSWTSGGQ